MILKDKKWFLVQDGCSDCEYCFHFQNEHWDESEDQQVYREEHVHYAVKELRQRIGNSSVVNANNVPIVPLRVVETIINDIFGK